jgi:hypothetical protein
MAAMMPMMHTRLGTSSYQQSKLLALLSMAASSESEQLTWKLYLRFHGLTVGRKLHL